MEIDATVTDIHYFFQLFVALPVDINQPLLPGRKMELSCRKVKQYTIVTVEKEDYFSFSNVLCGDVEMNN